MMRGAISRRHGARVPGFLALMLAASFMGCSTNGLPTLPAIPTLATPSPGPAVAHSMDVRAQNGLRADRAWVEAVERDPASLERMGIKLSPNEAAAFDAGQLREAIELRTAVGLRADEAFVRQVLADPSSVPRLGTLLVSPEEAATIDRAMDNARDAGGVLEAYGKEHPDEWAGVYLDASGGVVAQVTGHLAEHRAAMAALFVGTQVRLEARQVRWSVRELMAFRKRIWKPAFQSWLAGEGISLEGVGSPPTLNRVTVEVETDGPRPGVEQLIIDHLDAADWLVVTSRADWARHLGRGTLVVTVVDQAGRPVTDASCFLRPDVPGALEDGSEVRDLDERGVCRWQGEFEIAATGYRVEVWRSYQKGFLGAGRVVVPDDGEGRLTIRTAGG